jgi:WD40 repeat protein
MRAPRSLAPFVASVLPLAFVAACGGPVEVAVVPPSAPPASASAAASVTATEQVPPPAPRVAGSKFVASAAEPLPFGAIARCGTTAMRVRDRGPVAVTNDGALYVVRNREQLVDPRKDEVLATLPRHERAVFSPDAQRLAIMRSDDVVELLEIPSGRSLGSSKIELTKPKPSPRRGKGLFSIVGPSGNRETADGLAYSLDGSRIVLSTSFGAFHVIDASSGKRTKSQKIANARLAGLSRDGSRALVLLRESTKANSDAVYGLGAESVGFVVVDLTTGAKLLTKKFEPEEALPTQPGAPSRVLGGPASKARKHARASHALSLDGLTVYRRESGDFSSIDVATGQEEAISSGDASDLSLGFMGGGPMTMEPDGKHARVGGSRVNLRTGRSEPAQAFEFRSENGLYQLQRSGSVLHLDSEEVVGHANPVASLAFMPHGEALVSADGTLHFWDAADCSELSRPKQSAREFRAARDSGAIVIDGYPTLIVRGREGVTEIQRALQGPNLALSNDGARLFVATSDFEEAKLDVIDAAKGKPVSSVHLGGSAAGVAVSPGGSRVAVRIREDKKTELQVRNADTLAIEATARLVDDSFQFLGEDHLLIWGGHRGVTELALPRMGEGFKLGGAGCCSVLAVSHDQRRIAGAANDEIFVWELTARGDGAAGARFLTQLSGHTGRVTSLAFSSEGVLASGSEDTTVLLWDVDKATKPAESTDEAKSHEGPLSRSRWSTGDSGAHDYVRDDGTVAWRFPKDKHPVLTGVVSVATNYQASCAVTDAPAGKVRCWGTTRGGVLGIAEKPDKKPNRFIDQETPVAVPNVSDALRVDLAGDYGCALHAGDKVSCWGRLGSGGISPPTQVLAGVVSFALRPGRACALTTGSELVCWNSSSDPRPETIAAKVKSFGMGRSHVCFLGSDGHVSCAGAGPQLGDGTSGDRDTPAIVDRLSQATDLAVGSSGTCARAKPVDREEGVYCWGAFAHATHIVPTLMRGLSDTTGLLVLGDRVCATKRSGLVCLGS